MADIPDHRRDLCDARHDLRVVPVSAAGDIHDPDLVHRTVPGVRTH